MPTNNSIDAPFPFAATIGGTAQSSYTTGDTIYASASNTLSKLSVGSDGDVYTVQSGIPGWITPATGSTVGYSQTISTTATSTSTNISDTGTTPTTSNTTSLINLTYTASSTSNYLIFEFGAPMSSSAAGSVVGFFLFSGTTLLCSFPTTVPAGQPASTFWRYAMLASSTSSTTYSVYYAGSSGTTYMLSNQGTAFYNSSTSTQMSFSVLEITV